LELLDPDREENDELGLVLRALAVAEELSQDGDLPEERDFLEGTEIVFPQESADRERLAVLHADDGLLLPGRDLRVPAAVHLEVAGDHRDLRIDAQEDRTVRPHPRGELDVDADARLLGVERGRAVVAGHLVRIKDAVADQDEAALAVEDRDVRRREELRV